MEKTELTSGSIAKRLLFFSGPMILGNLLQQIYSFADTIIVGRFLGDQALAAVGSTYTLTTFLYSIVIGFCMGCGSLVSFCYGKKEKERMQQYMMLSFLITGTLGIVMEVGTLFLADPILRVLQTPDEIFDMTRSYVFIILIGIIFVFFYNYYAYILRGMGNSLSPLLFLGIASLLNIGLDYYLVVNKNMGVKGAAYATVFSQAVSGIGLMIYTLWKVPLTRFSLKTSWGKEEVKNVIRQSGASSIQQSVMNFGILMIQGLVNHFGTLVMAAFTVAVKIDTIAYMPAQEYGNAYSLFLSQNYGAGKKDRVRQGTKLSFLLSGIFCGAVSVFVFIFAKYLMGIFVKENSGEVIAIGIQYLRIEGTFYLGIGFLFLLYGYFRGVQRAEMSLVLTVISLGTRVALAYLLSAIPAIGVVGIWVSIPIGWFLADLFGGYKMLKDITGGKNERTKNKINRT